MFCASNAKCESLTKDTTVGEGTDIMCIVTDGERRLVFHSATRTPTKITIVFSLYGEEGNFIWQLALEDFRRTANGSYLRPDEGIFSLLHQTIGNWAKPTTNMIPFCFRVAPMLPTTRRIDLNDPKLFLTTTLQNPAGKCFSQCYHLLLKRVWKQVPGSTAREDVFTHYTKCLSEIKKQTDIRILHYVQKAVDEKAKKKTEADAARMRMALKRKEGDRVTTQLY